MLEKNFGKDLFYEINKSQVQESFEAIISPNDYKDNYGNKDTSSKENNANIIGYACIIDRSNGKSEIKNKIISQVELNIPTYKKNDLPKELLSIEAVKPGSRNL